MDLLDSVHDLNGIEISIYPNPVSDILTIQSDIELQSILYSLDGKIISSSTDDMIDVSQIISGVYLLRISDSSNNSIVERIEVQN